ncbi:hypothetical protein JCM19274_121 [Algibacter lectus]|uniref:Secretion system C-terminal sorting domain-containing protein n=1 Tax=Algibacter lectus TaxID=221126 RepID=A0A090WYA6_9FLAO|nr:hypothetical protein JCM19274_121 [Algibacter lectus]
MVISNESAEIKIYNSLGGALVKTLKSQEKSTAINVSSLSTGLYIIKIKTNTLIASKKIVLNY